MRTCWSGTKYCWITTIKTCCINILCVINIPCPIDLLNFMKWFKVPNLNLICCRIISCQNFSILVIQRFSRYVWPIEMAWTFWLSNIPYMYNTVPASWNYCIIINKFNCKNAIVMSNIVPSSWMQIANNRFSFFVN
jgi:hypothetical protein